MGGAALRGSIRVLLTLLVRLLILLMLLILLLLVLLILILLLLVLAVVSLLTLSLSILATVVVRFRLARLLAGFDYAVEPQQLRPCFLGEISFA